MSASRDTGYSIRMNVEAVLPFIEHPVSSIYGAEALMLVRFEIRPPYSQKLSRYAYSAGEPPVCTKTTFSPFLKKPLRT